MSSDAIPYELKRLIYEFVDLQTIKSLRQVSKAWASVGVELLLLPTFRVTSHSHDLQRLIGIGSNPTLSLQATKVISRIAFQNSGWDPRYLRRIVCNRHEHRGHYDVVDFVPTQAETDALEELDTIIERKDKDDKTERNNSFLVSALRVVPQVNSIEIESQSPFLHPILRKVWEEYSLEAYRPQPYRENQFLRVLHAARMAGLTTQHFGHDQLLSSYFADGALEREDGFTLHDDISSLKSLELTVSDHQGLFSTDGRAVIQLRELIFATPRLENLSLNFEILESISLDFLPTTPTGALRSLSLSSITVDPVKLLAFLEGHASTLKRLRLRFVNIPPGQGSWRNFLDDLKNSFGHKLEKFQMSGMVRSVDGDGEQWLLWPRYDLDWNVLEKERNPRTRELEDFVLREGSWPMVSTDTFPFPQ